MARVVTIAAPRTVVLEEEPDRPLEPHEVRIETLYSGISAGTELTAYRGTNPYLDRRWDPERRLFLAGEGATFAYPLRGWGYEEVGRIVETGDAVPRRDDGLRPGALVHGTWGHRSHHVASAEEAAAKLLPSGLPPVAGILSHVGPIALNGVLDAAPRLGETVAVFGLGVVGQLVARLAAAAGARVIGVDRSPFRLEAARAAGALDHAIDAREGAAGETIKDLTDGRGADVAIEAAGAAAALHEAVRAVAYGARVVVLGFVQGDAVGLRLGEEFHHNRVQLVASQISGVAAELAPRWDRARLIRTVMELQATGRLDARSLISDVVPWERAPEAFRRLDEEAPETLLVVLAGPDAPPLEPGVRARRRGEE